MLEGKKIFLTGGAGFIGTALALKLVEQNEIIIYDSLRRNSIKFTDLLKRENVKLCQGDILDFGLLEQTIMQIKPSVVIHLAAIAGIDTVIKSPTTTMKVNLLGTYNVLEALMPIMDKIERFIFFSTSEIFGSYAYKVEESHPSNLAPVGAARWTYAVSKLAGEHLVHSYHKEFGLKSVIIRPFNIYGPGQVGEGAIHVFITRALQNLPIYIHGDGDQIRSWCYIDDLVQGVLLCLENEKAIGNAFNIGNPRGTITIRSLAEKIILLANSESEIQHIPKPYVDVELRIPDITKAQTLLGYSPKVDLDEGIKRTITWYRERLKND